MERPCFTSGCPNTTSGQYCHDCGLGKETRSQERDRERGNASQRGYGAKWQSKRKAFLARYENRFCHCGCGKRSMDVDHIKAVTGPNDPLFWDETNWQPLAHGCHSSKTIREDGGFGNHPRERNTTDRPLKKQETGFRIA